jgi:hypothetical protein
MELSPCSIILSSAFLLLKLYDRAESKHEGFMFTLWQGQRVDWRKEESENLNSDCVRARLRRSFSQE